MLTLPPNTGGPVFIHFGLRWHTLHHLQYRVIGLTKATALEVATEANITANAVCPGWVLTPLVAGSDNDDSVTIHPLLSSAAQIELRQKATAKTYEEAKRDLLSEKQPSGMFLQAKTQTNRSVLGLDCCRGVCGAVRFGRPVCVFMQPSRAADEGRQYQRGRRLACSIASHSPGVPMS